MKNHVDVFMENSAGIKMIVYRLSCGHQCTLVWVMAEDLSPVGVGYPDHVFEGADQGKVSLG